MGAPITHIKAALKGSTRPLAEGTEMKDEPTPSEAGTGHARGPCTERWWETAAGIKIVTLKEGRKYGHEISITPDIASRQLDEIVAEGFQAIEIFAPAEGLHAYSGLDTKNHYQIDPELGTMDDFRALVCLAHDKGLAVLAFINLGYMSAEAPDWLEACRDKRAGKNTEKAKWFLWSDRGDAPTPYTQEDVYVTEEERAAVKTWGWQYSELAGAFFWARWEAHDADGNAIPLPQNNWASKEWRRESERIVRFWMDTGIDGMLIDAPLCYPFQTWEHNRAHITSVMAGYGNVYMQPEGGRDVEWLTEAGYNSIQDYGLRFWGGKWQEDAITHAIKHGDATRIEESLQGYHDVMVAAGGSLYFPALVFEERPQQHLARAVLAGIGTILAYNRGAGSPDAEEAWILRMKKSHPALHQLGTRRQLNTNDDSKYYACLRTAPDGTERLLAVFNFQPVPQTVLIDLSGVSAERLISLRNGESRPHMGSYALELPAYGYQFCQLIP